MFFWREGKVLSDGKRKIITYFLMSLLVTEPIEVNGSVAICGLLTILYVVLRTGGGKGVYLKGREPRGEELNRGEE